MIIKLCWAGRGEYKKIHNNIKFENAKQIFNNSIKGKAMICMTENGN